MRHSCKGLSEVNERNQSRTQYSRPSFFVVVLTSADSEEESLREKLSKMKYDERPLLYITRYWDGDFGFGDIYIPIKCCPFCGVNLMVTVQGGA